MRIVLINSYRLLATYHYKGEQGMQDAIQGLLPVVLQKQPGICTLFARGRDSADVAVSYRALVSQFVKADTVGSSGMYSLEVTGALTEELAGRSEIATAETYDSLEVVTTRLRLADRTTKSNRELMRLGASASVDKEPSDGAADSLVVRRADPGYFAALERYLASDPTGFRWDLNSLVVRFLDPGSANAKLWPLMLNRRLMQQLLLQGGLWNQQKRLLRQQARCL
jgi:hypothetical protein